MVNQTAVIGRVAVVQIDAVTRAWAQGYTVNESLSVVSEYVLEPSGTAATGWPAVSGATTKQGSIDIDELDIDNTIEAKFELMALVTVICGPVGSSGGNKKDTYTGFINKVNTTVKTNAFTTKKVSITITAAPIHSTWP